MGSAGNDLLGDVFLSLVKSFDVHPLSEFICHCTLFFNCLAYFIVQNLLSQP